MTDNSQHGETEEEYYARIKAVPGIFSDKNESAKQVVEKADTNLQHAEALSEATALAPQVHLDDEKAEDADEESKETPEEEKTEEEKALEQSPVQEGDQAPVLAPSETPEATGDTANASFPVAHIDGSVETFENEGGVIKSETHEPEQQDEAKADDTNESGDVVADKPAEEQAGQESHDKTTKAEKKAASHKPHKKAAKSKKD